MHPQRVGSIRIEGVLGEGAMGTVYVGFDETLERRVAVKALRRRLGRDAAFQARFLREARVLSQLEHPNVCRIHGWLDEGGREYLVLEYVEGHPLSRHLSSGGLRPWHRLEIALQVAEALVAAHSRGVVHRDLKPDNVMVTPEGDVKVLDFGLARTLQPAQGGDDAAPSSARAPPAGAPSADASAAHGAARAAEPAPAPWGADRAADDDASTELGTVMGTPLYMSPEQARGEEVSTASDMYAFGLLLQALYTDRSPYPAGISRAALLHRAARGDALPPEGLPAAVQRLVLRLREPAPATRATAVEARHRLRRLQQRPARILRRAAAVLLALLALGAGTKYTLDVRHQRRLAEAAAERERVQRALAERRRDAAESLVGFMLDDLREQLRAAGRLELLDNVGAEALEYFAGLPEEELSNEELARRAQALYQIGEVASERGDLPSALEAFREALALGERVVAADPLDESALVQLGYAHFHLGSGFWTQGDLQGARAQFEASADVARRLVALDPANPEYRMELAAEESNVAQVLEAQGEHAAAAEVLRERLATVRELVRSDPERADWQLELANSELLLGRVLEAQGALDRAEAHYRADLEILLDLVGRDPDHAQRLDRLATSYSYLGGLLKTLDRRAEADDCFAEQATVSERLAAGDAANAGWRDHLATSLLNQGTLWREAGDVERARAPLRHAARIFAELSRQDPERERWRDQSELAQRRYERLLAEADAGPDD